MAGPVGTGAERELTHRRPAERHRRTRPAGPPRWTRPAPAPAPVAQVNRMSGLNALPSGRARPGRSRFGTDGRASFGGALTWVAGSGGGGGAGADGAETG